MDGWIGEWVGSRHGKVGGLWMDVWWGERRGGLLAGWIDGQMDRLLDGWTGGWMAEWVEWKDEWTPRWHLNSDPRLLAVTSPLWSSQMEAVIPAGVTGNDPSPEPTSIKSISISTALVRGAIIAFALLL